MLHGSRTDIDIARILCRISIWGTGVIVNPSIVYGESHTGDEDILHDIEVVSDVDDDEQDDEQGEKEGRVGLLSVASSLLTSLLGRQTSSQHLSLPGSGSGRSGQLQVSC